MRGFAASWVVTGDPAQEPIERGAVVVDGLERVIEVGPAVELRARHPQAEWRELGAVLLPGLCNAHTHLELSRLRGEVPGGRGFVPWVRGMLDARARLSPERDEETIGAAVSELLAAGTAAVGEVSNSLASVPLLAGAPIVGCVFHEVFGMRRDTGQAMARMAEQARDEIAAWPENLSYTPTPHTPYTLHPEVLVELVARARALGRRASLHLCEHPAERAYLADHGGPFAAFVAERGATVIDWSPPGLDPVRYAERLGVLAPDVICVHLCDARQDEIALVARAKAPVVLCPRSNLHISLKLPPLPALLEAGIRPGLGTDSLASAPNLDVLAEARALAERFVGVAARTLIAMATSFGADALGLGHRLGRIAPGLSPGLVAFPHGADAPEDPERFVLSAKAAERLVVSRPAAVLDTDAACRPPLTEGSP